MTPLDMILSAAIIGFLILIVWSRIQNQRMIDTVNEIKEILEGFKKPIK